MFASKFSEDFCLAWKKYFSLTKILIVIDIKLNSGLISYRILKSYTRRNNPLWFFMLKPAQYWHSIIRLLIVLDLVCVILLLGYKIWDINSSCGVLLITYVFYPPYFNVKLHTFFYCRVMMIIIII